MGSASRRKLDLRPSKAVKGESVMTGGSQNGPVLFCFDGSDGSRNAMRAAAGPDRSSGGCRRADGLGNGGHALGSFRRFRGGGDHGGCGPGFGGRVLREVSGRGGRAPGKRARIPSLTDDQGVLRRDCEDHFGGGGRSLSPLDRMWPTGSGRST